MTSGFPSKRRSRAKQVEVIEDIDVLGDSDLLAVGDDDRMVEVPVDSGAVEVVAPPDFAKDYDIVPGEAFRSGKKYRAANGGILHNEGEKRVEFLTENGDLRRLCFQIAKVTKPLISAGKITAKNHRVVLDDDDAYIEHKITGVRTPLYKRNGVFVLRMWIRRPHKNQRSNTSTVNNVSGSSCPMDVDSADMSGFTRPGR